MNNPKADPSLERLILPHQLRIKMSPPDAQGDLGTKVVIVAIVCLFLATLSAALRLYVRVAIVKQFGYDDWAAALTWVCFLH